MDPATNYTDVNHLVKDLVEDVHEEYEEETAAMPTKEHEPPTHHEVTHLEQAVEHEASGEVVPFVETRKEIPDISPEVEEQGVTATPTTNFPTFEEVKLPISDEKIVEGLEKPITSSWRWLSELCMYLLHQVHQTLKNIHGKVMRVAISSQ